MTSNVLLEFGEAGSIRIRSYFGRMAIVYELGRNICLSSLSSQKSPKSQVQSNLI